MTDNNGKNNGEQWHDATHRFANGNPGRQPGSKNKLRDEIRSFLAENWKEWPTWFAALKPKEKIEVMLALLPYSVGRVQPVAMTDNGVNEGQGRAVIDYSKLSQGALKEILSVTKIEKDETGE